MLEIWHSEYFLTSIVMWLVDWAGGFLGGDYITRVKPSEVRFWTFKKEPRGLSSIRDTRSQQSLTQIESSTETDHVGLAYIRWSSTQGFEYLKDHTFLIAATFKALGEFEYWLFKHLDLGFWIAKLSVGQIWPWPCFVNKNLLEHNNYTHLFIIVVVIHTHTHNYICQSFMFLSKV